MPETDAQKIRDELEDITRELVKLNDEYEKICKKIDRLPTSQLDKLKGLCNEKARIYTRKQFLENQKHNKINLLQLNWEW